MGTSGTSGRMISALMRRNGGAPFFREIASGPGNPVRSNCVSQAGSPRGWTREPSWITWRETARTGSGSGPGASSCGAAAMPTSLWKPPAAPSLLRARASTARICSKTDARSSLSCTRASRPYPPSGVPCWWGPVNGRLHPKAPHPLPPGNTSATTASTPGRKTASAGSSRPQRRTMTNFPRRFRSTPTIWRDTAAGTTTTIWGGSGTRRSPPDGRRIGSAAGRTLPSA